MTLTAKDVAEITRLLEESQFDELQLEHEGFTLTLRARRGGRRCPQGRRPAGRRAGARAPARPACRSPPPCAGLREVRAPLLGTFHHRAPKPGAAAYVEAGSGVEEDPIVGIIEVMKLMNTVRAGVQGTVAQILAQDGALVEYGQVLLLLAQGPR